MRVIRCEEKDRGAWNAFAAGPHGSFYHRFEWRDVFEAAFGHRMCYLAAVDRDQMMGVFPVVQVKSRLFGNLACSLPFLNYGGPCALNEDVEQRLLESARQVADEWGVKYLEIRSRHRLGGELPVAEHKVSLRLRLNRDSERLWSAFKTSHRQDIRRGYKNGFSVKFGGIDLLDDFYAVLSETWRDLGTPIYSKRFPSLILTAFPTSTRIAVVYMGSEPAAAAFDGFDATTIEGMWLGVRARYRNKLAGYILYWELIKHACERNFTSYHLGRSTSQSSAETFKKKWNATPEQLYWHYILGRDRTIPQLNVQNPRYKLAISAWRHLPVPITQAVGPLIARSIP